MKYIVRDGVRSLTVIGTKLAESSSRQPNKPRWVEFELFITSRGQYVLSRIGKSVLFHDESCDIVTRNRLSAVDGDELGPEYIPCRECKPSRINVNGVFPETPRYFAQKSDKPKGVIEALLQYDDNGTEYLTYVACELLEEASQHDELIKQAYLFSVLD